MPRLLASCCALMLVTATTAAQAGKLVVTLDGKAVTAVPVDRLPEVVIKVDAGSSYSQIYKGQWGSLEHALYISARAFDKGTAAPNPDSRGSWAESRIEYSGADKSWGSKSSSTPNTKSVIRQTQFFSYDTSQSVLLAVGYRRQVYTGKLIMEGNKLIKETRWEYAGPVVAQTVIALEKPTFASSYDAAKTVAGAEAVANTKQAALQYNDSFAAAATRHLIAKNTYNKQTLDFTGSVAKSFKSSGPTRYSWNYDENGDFDYITAVEPLAFALHAKKTIVYEGFPKPEIIEGDFVCSGGSAAAVSNRPIKSGAFTFKETRIGDPLRSGCKTADGKTGDDLAATAKGPLDLEKTRALQKNTTMTEEEKAAELIKQLGMDPNAK